MSRLDKNKVREFFQRPAESEIVASRKTKIFRAFDKVAFWKIAACIIERGIA